MESSLSTPALPGRQPRTADVGIVGGGPVGMMLALFLERHGVATVLFNTDSTPRAHPKGSTHNSRTMEHYRRLGLSAAVRRLGLPASHPTDVAYFTRYNSYELARVIMPSGQEKLRAVIAAPTTVQEFEPIHRANQMYVEKLLLEQVRSRPRIVARYGWQVTSFEEEAEAVAVIAEQEHGEQAELWRCRYVVGCDGGQSQVRRQLGIRYAGHDPLRQDFLGGGMMSTYLRAPGLRDCMRGREAWQYWAVNPSIRTAMVSLNGDDEFLYWTRLESGARWDPAVAVRGFHAACGFETPVSLLGHESWTGGVALWAERLWSGHRVFLAGDAIHLFTPTGGFGMNTGIDGAGNLAWKLAALVQGWGGPALAASYEAERKPVAVRNTTAAQLLAKNVGAIRIEGCIEEASSRGDAARRDAGAYLETFGEEFASVGVQLGVRYDGSPLIVEDGVPPRDSYVAYIPSGVPGGRAPHVFLDPPGMRQRRSLFDLFGVGFTLLRLGRRPPAAEALTRAAQRRGMPLDVVEVPDDDARELYGRDLALVRPDQHICWRGDALPGDCDALLRRVIGA